MMTTAAAVLSLSVLAACGEPADEPMEGEPVEDPAMDEAPVEEEPAMDDDMYEDDMEEEPAMDDDMDEEMDMEEEDAE